MFSNLETLTVAITSKSWRILILLISTMLNKLKWASSRGTLNLTNNVLTSVESKTKGTFAENWFKFWKNVFMDYKAVAFDVRQEMKEKPLKCFGIFTGASILTCCGITNPNERSFRSQFLEAANNLVLVHPDMQNPEASRHLKNIEQFYNRDLIRRSSFIVFSFIWVDKHSSSCNTYESNCSYTKVSGTDITKRILDVGFLNNWWVLSRKMLDYDINY